MCPVIAYIRSKSSIEKFGDNLDVHVRSDCNIMVVTTTLGNILTYSISHSDITKEIAVFTYSDNSPLFIYEGQTIRTAFPGPGEASGVHEMYLQFKMIVRLDSGMSTAISLDKDLMIATKSPPAIQFVKWDYDLDINNDLVSSNSSSGHQTRTIILSHLEWLSKKYKEEKHTILNIFWSKSMRLFVWILSDGSVWTVSMNDQKEGRLSVSSGYNLFLDGSCLHKPRPYESVEEKALCAEINARFSLIAVGCISGRTYLYNIKDYSGNFSLVRILEPPTPSSGKINTISCSHDGSGWFVGYESGWAFFSVYGMLNSSSFISSADQRSQEKWMDGIEKSVWSFSGDAIYLLPKDRSSIWVLDTIRWNMTGNFIQSGNTHTVLFKDSKIMLYRGQDLPDLTTIDKDALLWLNVPIPASYIADNWPIKYVACSSDGNYVAVAGIRGVTHYSLYSGMWKMFVEEDSYKDFSVHGGIIWYGNVLIMAVDTGSSHEIQLFLRELDLDSQNILFQETLPAPVIYMFLFGNSLLIYASNNNLYQFNIIVRDKEIELEPITEISFSGIIHSPGRVRSISCIPKHDDSTRVPFVLEESIILLLVDGMLIQLTPRTQNEVNLSDSGKMSYKLRVLHNYIEYYSFSGTQEDLKNMIWAFDGQNIVTWVNGVQENSNEYEDLAKPILVPIELYPLTMLTDKGIVMGVECDAVLTRSGSFTYFKQWTSAQLFLPYILESYLRNNNQQKALSVAKSFRSLNYFEHMLEVLLYDVLVNASSVIQQATSVHKTTKHDSTELLKSAVYFISQFPEMPDVVVNCTRKIEIKYWSKLFSVLGSPQALFEQCIDKEKLVTAGGYLLVLHNLDQNTLTKNKEHDISLKTMDNTIQLLKVANNSKNWDLCKELLRFVRSIDPSGELFKKVLVAANIVVPII